MQKDFTIILQDSPGTLADLCEILDEAGVNIEGVCAVTYKGECPIHILVDDAQTARKVLEDNWINILSEQDVILVKINDRPGFLAEKAREFAESRINIEVVYLTTNAKLVFVVDNLKKGHMLFHA